MPLWSPFVQWVDAVSPHLLRLTGWRSRSVQTSLGRLHWFEVEGSGDGPPLVLLHGLSSRAADHVVLVALLRRRHRRIVMPDLPGHGWSEGEAPEAEHLHTLLAEILPVMVPEPAWVMGNSMGGLVAVRLAQAAPERVAGLVLASPAGAPMSDAQIAEVQRIFTIPDHPSALGFVDRLFGRRRGAPALVKHLVAAGVLRRAGIGAVRHILSRIRNEHLLRGEELAGLRMPILLFWGAADRILDAGQLDWYRRHLPAHAVVETPEEFGHTPFFDRPREFADRLVAFVREARGRVGRDVTDG